MSCGHPVKVQSLVLVGSETVVVAAGATESQPDMTH
jgi:hypothetical protein